MRRSRRGRSAEPATAATGSVSASGRSGSAHCSIVADRRDRPAFGGGRRLDDEVALAVGPHRAVGDVGRADAQQPIVDDHHLGMDHHVDAALGAVDLREGEEGAVVEAGLAKRLDDAEAAVLHRHVLDEGMVALRRDDHRLEARPRDHAGDQGVGDRVAGEELVLQIDRPLGGRDHVGEQRLDLADGRRAVALRRGASDADGDVAELRLDARRPGVRITRRGICQGLAGRIDAARVVGVVAGRVPAPDGDVEAARKGEPVVDDRDLLVLRGADRRLLVEGELDLRRRLPLQGDADRRLALERIEHRGPPQEELDREIGRALHEGG